jgi:hypothetical protein
MDSYIPRRMDITAQLELNSNTFSDSSSSIPLIFLDCRFLLHDDSVELHNDSVEAAEPEVRNLFHAGSGCRTGSAAVRAQMSFIKFVVGEQHACGEPKRSFVRAVKHSKYRAFYRFLTMSSITTTGRTMRASAGIVVAGAFGG